MMTMALLRKMSAVNRGTTTKRGTGTAIALFVVFLLLLGFFPVKAKVKMKTTNQKSPLGQQRTCTILYRQGQSSGLTSSSSSSSPSSPSSTSVELFANCSGLGLLECPAGIATNLSKAAGNHLEFDLEVDLSDNELKLVEASSSTGKGLVKLAASLRNLNLARNKIVSFSYERTSSPMVKLKKLDLSKNKISSTRGLRLSGLVRLEELDLSGNNLMSLPEGSFKDVAGSLKSLNLKANSLLSLEPGSLRPLAASLEELILSKNKLSSLPRGLFDGLSGLKVLELNRNKFVEVRSLSFQGLTGLKVLRMRRNQIQYLMDGAFFGLSSIEELSLDWNRMRDVNKGWLYGLTTLRYLSLANNRVDHIAHEDAWEFCKALQTLDLRANRLQILDRPSLKNLPELRALFLQDNAISHIETYEEGEGAVSAFTDLGNLEKLFLDGNQISHTIEDVSSPFHGLANLALLSLSQNHIKSIGGAAFKGGLSRLHTIDLSGNVISTVQEGAMDATFLPALRFLNLDSRSMLCDCHLQWFPRWLNDSGVAGADNATCTHPESLKGIPVTKVPSGNAFTCDDSPKPYIITHPETQIGLKGKDLVLQCRAASTSSAEMVFEWRVDNERLLMPVSEVRTLLAAEVSALSSSSSPEDAIAKSAAASPADEAAAAAPPAVNSGTSNLCPGVDANRGYDRCVVNMAHLFDGKGREITSELRLENLTYDDEGRYQCVVSNRFGATYSDKASISVHVFPTFVVTSEDILVEEGGTALMRCAARGVPPPEVMWTKDSGTDFPAATERRIKVSAFNSNQDRRAIVHSFEIWDVKEADVGVYSCTASNPAGSISWNITLSLLEAPSFAKRMEDKSVLVGDSAVMECMAAGSPKPKLFWFKDGAKVEQTEKQYFAAEEQLLVIVSASREDSGRYECRLENKVGTVSQSSTLSVVTTLPPNADRGNGNDDESGDDDRSRQPSPSVNLVDFVKDSSAIEAIMGSGKGGNSIPDRKTDGVRSRGDGGRISTSIDGGGGGAGDPDGNDVPGGGLTAGNRKIIISVIVLIGCVAALVSVWVLIVLTRMRRRQRRSSTTTTPTTAGRKLDHNHHQHQGNLADCPVAAVSSVPGSHFPVLDRRKMAIPLQVCNSGLPLIEGPATHNGTASRLGGGMWHHGNKVNGANRRDDILACVPMLSSPSLDQRSSATATILSKSSSLGSGYSSGGGAAAVSIYSMQQQQQQVQRQPVSKPGWRSPPYRLQSRPSKPCGAPTAPYGSSASPPDHQAGDEGRSNGESPQGRDSSSERDSGTGDSKKSSETVDEVDDDGAEPDEDDGDENDGESEPLRRRRCSFMRDKQGGGEAAMSLREFEDTTTTELDQSGESEPIYENSPAVIVVGVGPRSPAADLSSVAPDVSAEGLPREDGLQGGVDDELPQHESGGPLVSPTVEFRTFNLDNPRRKTSSLSVSQRNLLRSEWANNSRQGRMRSSSSYWRRSSTLEADDVHDHCLGPSGDFGGGVSLTLSGRFGSSSTAIGADTTAVVDAAEYRGGTGTLPRRTGLELQQRLLEESLNNSDYVLDRRKRVMMGARTRGKTKFDDDQLSSAERGRRIGGSANCLASPTRSSPSALFKPKGPLRTSIRKKPEDKTEVAAAAAGPSTPGSRSTPSRYSLSRLKRGSSPGGALKSGRQTGVAAAGEKWSSVPDKSDDLFLA